ncbi:flippase-like domain-containing protein [Desulfatiferula olefinivorans]
MTDSRVSTSEPLARLGRFRLTCFIGLFLVLSVGTPWVIFRQCTEQAASWTFRLPPWPFLIGAAGLLAVYFTCDGLRLHHTLKALGHSVSGRHMGRLVFINILFSNITPMAGGGGFAQIWYLRRHGVPLGAATAATTLRTVLAMLFIFIPAPLLLRTMPSLKDSPLTQGLTVSFAVFACLGLALFFLMIFRIDGFIRIIDRLLRIGVLGRLIGPSRTDRLRIAVRRELRLFSRGIRDYLTGPRRHVLLSVVYTAVFLMTFFSFPAFLMWSLGYPVDYPAVLCLMIAATFVMYFSPTPGASGIAEALFTLFFASMIRPGDLVPVMVGWRLMTIYLGMLIGVPVTVAEMARRKGRHGA